jgi:hypothetical protein
MNTRKNEQIHHSKPAASLITSALHRRVFTLLVIFALWFALAVWGFAGGGGATDYLLLIVSGFIGIAVGLPLILARVARADDHTEREHDSHSLCEWAASDFETGQDRISGRQAALQILLPIAAAAIGMTIYVSCFVWPLPRHSKCEIAVNSVPRTN